MAYRELEEEAKRVKEKANTWRAGIHLSAIFKNGALTEEVFYINPKDIPIKIPHIGIWLFLYSVCPVEKRKYPEPKKEPDPQRHFRV